MEERKVQKKVYRVPETIFCGRHAMSRDYIEERVTNCRRIAKREDDKGKGENRKGKRERKTKVLRCKEMIKKRARQTRWAMPCEKREEKKNMHEYATRKPLRPLMTSCESRPATVYEDKAKKKR